jgi:hypothetical protein
MGAALSVAVAALRAALRGAAGLLGAPRSAVALARRVHALDLSADMRRVSRHQIPTTVVACVTDAPSSAG